MNKVMMFVLVSLWLFALPTYAAFVVTPQELSTQQSTVLDARSTQSYETGHIEGAINFPVDWTYEEKSVDGTIVSPAKAQSILRKLGIETTTPVVIYDNGSMMDAARLFWTLEVYGLKNVQVLDGGYAAWSSLGLPQSLDQPARQASQYVANVDHHRIVTKLTTLAATKNPQQVIIDARSPSDYLGKTSTAKRYGHIPAALNIPAAQNIRTTETQGATFLSADKLEHVYAEIPKTSRVILYCAIGRISSSNYLALRTLGYDVANYDASWHQWGNDENLPIHGGLSPIVSP